MHDTVCLVLYSQTHFNFLEHRERLSREVDTIAAANCVVESPVELQPPRKSKKQKRTEPSSVTGAVVFQYMWSSLGEGSGNRTGHSHFVQVCKT